MVDYKTKMSVDTVPLLVDPEDGGPFKESIINGVHAEEHDNGRAEHNIVEYSNFEEETNSIYDKEKSGKRKIIPAWRVFRYADCLDALMIFIGFFTSIIAGMTVPLHALIFGEAIDIFIFHSMATNVIDNTSVTILAHSLARSFNETCRMLSREDPEIISETITNVSMVRCLSKNERILDNIVDFACEPSVQLVSDMQRIAILYVILASINLVMEFISLLFYDVSAYRQTRQIRQAFYNSILHQEIGWFDVSNVNELNGRLVDDIEKIQTGIGNKLSLVISNLSTFFAGFVIAFIINWKVALVVSTMLPIIIIQGGVIAKAAVKFALREQSAYAVAGAIAQEVISSIRTVVAFGGEDRELERYNVNLLKAQKEGFMKWFLWSLIAASFSFTFLCVFALTIWYTSTLLTACHSTTGDMVQVFFAIAFGCFYLGSVIPELEIFTTAISSASCVYQVINRQPLIDSSSDAGSTPDKMHGNISFSDVVFSYPARPNVQVLRGLDLSIKSGQRIALVGPSGCGKSTVIQLIQRFYDADGGQITIDGHEIGSLNLKWLRSQIGVVSQEPVLFDTTIAENIRHGREEASMEDIQEVAKKANAHEFISKLPDGYDTYVGEGGAQLSGGQKQRIAIARALVRDPKVLLLDEATSALDTESEKVVQDALDKAREGRTTIIIAHRLSTIQTADIIISLKSGRVAERGTHAELMERRGLYYELVTAQTISAKDDDSKESKELVKVKSQPTLAAPADDQSSQPKVSQASREQSPHYDSKSSLLKGMSQFRYGSIRNSEDAVSVISEEDEKERNVFEEAHKKKEKPTAPLLARKKKVKEISFKELLRLNKPDWPLVLIGMIFATLIGAVFPIMSVIFSITLGVFGRSDREEIESIAEKLSGGFVGLAFFSGISTFLCHFALAVAGERLTRRLRYKSFQAMLRQEVGWFEQSSNSTGALTARLNSDAAEVKGITGIKLDLFTRTASGIIAAIIVSLIASWELTLLVVIIFPAMLMGGFLQIHMMEGQVKKNKKMLEESCDIAVESIVNIRTVVGLGTEESFFKKYKNLLAGPFKESLKSALLLAAIVSIPFSLLFYLLAPSFILAGFLVITKRATYPDIFQVTVAIMYTGISLGRALSHTPDVGKAKLAASAIFGLLKRESKIDASDPGGKKLGLTKADISVKDVHFNYPSRPDVQVLQGLNVSVKPGQTLALVGPSGCGKSTLVALMERFYDPMEGSVNLEGVDLRDLNLKWLRTQIGIVSQEPVLFDDTVAENIRYGALYREVSDAEVIEVAKEANVHSFIQSLPEGYDTNVGSKGTQLSGGQKQRIAIARALVRDPKVLLLDEATSALDTESEKVVQDALDNAREGRTTIVIAHRLSTIYNSDVIAVIHDGRVIESGTHSELMALQGAYYLLNTVQQKKP